MPRRKGPPKREILPDPLFRDVDEKRAVEVAKLVNIVMKDGKKSVAENIVRDALSIALTMRKEYDHKASGAAPKKEPMCEGRGHRARIAKSCNVRYKENDRAREEVLALFEKAMENICPNIEVRARRVGGSVYQVPTAVEKDRSHALGRRALVQIARSRGEHDAALSLGAELFAATQGHGGTVKIKENMLASAKANEVNAHYRW